MDATAISNALDELTGSWKPSGAATTSDLGEARFSLVDALASGLAPQAVHATPMFRTPVLGTDRSEVDALVRKARPTPTLSVMPNVRSGTDIDPAMAADFVGMKVSKTLGPFVDSFGVTHWIDLIPLPQKIPISSTTRGILGYLIIDTPTATTLGPGSIWIAAAAFDVPLLTSGAVGLSFSAGTVRHAGNVTISNAGVTIGSGGTLTLDLTLAPPPPLGSSGIGRDATQMALTLPSQVTIEFTVAGAGFIAIDDSAVTVYGTSFTLKRNANKPRVVKIGLDYLLYPCDISIPQFSFQTVLSTDIVPSGQSGVTGGGWALAITTAPPQQLGAASSAGSLVLELGSGLSLRFGDLTMPTSLANATLALAPNNITISAANGARAINDRLTLWTSVPPPVSLEPAPAHHASEIDATIGRGAVLLANVSPQREQAVAFGTARVSVDRPLAANGSRLPIAFASALIAFSRSATGKSVVADMSVPDVPPGGPQPQSALALENALLRVGPAATSMLNAAYSGTRLIGTLEFTFENAQIVPTLPDPYASANAFPRPLFGTVTALDSWTLQPGAVLRFGIVASSPAAAATQAAPAATTEGVTILLDLSGNADQFGVSVNTTRELATIAALDGLALAVPQEFLQVYTLPGISWEPVVDQGTNTWLNAQSPDDGPPTRLQVNTVNLVRVEPNIALPALAQAKANVEAFGSFTLPFGLMATLEIPSATPPPQRPSYSLINADFASGLSAAHQLSIRAESVIHVGDPALPGNTGTGSPVPVPLNSNVFGVLALGNDPLGAAQFFDQEFSGLDPNGTPQIPVTRIDISGYGTSMFSDWKDNTFDVGVVRARFDVLLGRTAYELVQIASVVIPYCFRITRTVIFDRYDGGLVVRHDTGLKPVGIGEFELLHPDQILLGPVEFLENIHNIAVGTGPTISFTSPDVHEPIPPSQPPPHPPTPLRTIEFVPVTFDADIMIGPSVTAVSNGNMTRLVAGTQIQGYAQLTVGPVASAREVLMAMQQLPDGVSGSVGCILNVGSAPGPNAPKFTFTVSSLTAKATSANVTGQNYPAVAVGLYGTPHLPRDGAWSITRRGQNDAAPTAVDPTFPIPLIFGSNNDRNYQWRLLDPEDGLSVSTPNTIFGLLQGTGTSKSLFENPVIASSGQSLLLDPNRGVPQPMLADIGSLLGAVGIFPHLANVLQIPTKPSDTLDLAQDGFQKTFSWTLEKSANPVVPLDDQVLLDLGIISLILQYYDLDSNNKVPTQATFTVDADPPAGSPRWSLSLDHLSLAAFVQGFGTDALLTIHGGFTASENQKPGFNNIHIDYGSALSIVRNVISGLTTLVEAMGGSVDLDVGFSDNKLTVKDGFTMPTIPLGLGEIEDIAIDLGMAIEIPDHADFHVELGSQDKPFTWIVDPLAGTGAIVLGTSDGDKGVIIEAGIGAALAIDLAVASGSASIVIEVSISTNISPFALTYALVGNATVDVLDGLASVSLTLAASITASLHWQYPQPDPLHPLPDSVDFGAGVAVGIHISVAWVASVDFDGSWSFNQRIPLHLPFGL